MINSKIIHEIQPDFMQEYYKGYTLQIDYDYLKKCYRDIDKIYFRQIKKGRKAYKWIYLKGEVTLCQR